MNTKLVTVFAVPALLFAAPVASAGGDLGCDPVTLAWSKPSYHLGESIELKITGTPGTFGKLFLNTDPGPIMLPGIGVLGVGVGPGLIMVPIRPINASGMKFYNCLLLCEDQYPASTFYTQAITISPNSGDMCLSNVDTLVITDDACAVEGCTPGIYKNKLELWADTGYAPTDDFDSVFGVDLFDPDITLLDALGMVGPGAEIFSAHAVAALLNATHPDVEYSLTEQLVITKVQNAVLSGDLEPTKDKLDQMNNAGCPL
jgi:hypothetical protein